MSFDAIIMIYTKTLVILPTIAFASWVLMPMQWKGK